MDTESFGSKPEDQDSRRIAVVLAAVGAVVLLYFMASAAIGTLTERACLSAGYTAGRVTATWGRYCVARVDASDVVLPLAEARRHPRR